MHDTDLLTLDRDGGDVAGGRVAQRNCVPPSPGGYSRLAWPVLLQVASVRPPVPGRTEAIATHCQRHPRPMLAGLGATAPVAPSPCACSRRLSSRAAATSLRFRVGAASRPVSLRSCRVRAAIAEPPQPVADSFKSVPRPDVNGRFGAYGGKYVPETLIASLLELEREYGTLKGDAAFQVRKRRLPAGSALPGGK